MGQNGFGWVKMGLSRLGKVFEQVRMGQNGFGWVKMGLNRLGKVLEWVKMS